MKTTSSLFGLRGKTAVITGGAGFLARQFAEILAEHGANLALIDLDKNEVRKRAEELARIFGVRTLPLYADITKEKDVRKAAGKIFKKFKRVDILVNNAAINPKVESSKSRKRFLALEKYPLSAWEKEISVGLTGCFICSREFAKFMEKRGGTIINISSIYGMVGPDQKIYKKGDFKPASYSASKSGVLGLTRHLAAYWSGKNIRVNALTLGGVFNRQDKNFLKKYSEKTLLGRMMNVEECKAPLLFLASGASSYMTGANLVVDGGWTAI